jgi:hypothetical protein
MELWLEDEAGTDDETGIEDETDIEDKLLGISELNVLDKTLLVDDMLDARLLDTIALELLLTATELLDGLVIGEDLFLSPPQADSPTTHKSIANCANLFM